MSHRHAAGLLGMPVLLLGAAMAAAQPGDAPGKPKPSLVVPDSAKPPIIIQDPTKPSAKLKEIMTVEKVGTIMVGASPKYPPVVLRGRVVAMDKPALAIVEMDGKTITVGKGSLLPGGVYRVLEVNSLEVIIEVISLKEPLILR